MGETYFLFVPICANSDNIEKDEGGGVGVAAIGGDGMVVAAIM